MNLIVFPSSTLGNTNSSPLVIRENSQATRIIILEQLLRQHLQKRFRQDDMSNQGRERDKSDLITVNWDHLNSDSTAACLYS